MISLGHLFEEVGFNNNCAVFVVVVVDFD